MATPVTNTAYGIINDAMVDAGLIGEGQRPNSDQLANNLRRLADIIYLWQTQGTKLFLQEEVQVPLTANQTSYILGPSGSTPTPDVVMERPGQITMGYVLNTSNIRRPLVLISRHDWERLSQITGNSGTINSFFADKQANYVNLHIWPPPDSTEAANEAWFLMRTQAVAPISLTADTSFPQEWRIALRWGLADDICTGQPSEIMNRCNQKATLYRQALQDYDVEDADTRIGMDMRFYTGSRSFT